jgi:hypothetical protein
MGANCAASAAFAIVYAAESAVYALSRGGDLSTYGFPGTNTSSTTVKYAEWFLYNGCNDNLGYTSTLAAR